MPNLMESQVNHLTDKQNMAHQLSPHMPTQRISCTQPAFIPQPRGTTAAPPPPHHHLRLSMNPKTWPATSHSSHFSALSFSSSSSTDPQKKRCTRFLPSSPTSHPDFSSLPFDLLARISASFTIPNLWAASLVCRSWREALRPLREAMALLKWGKRFKHGGRGIRPNLQKALDSFRKGSARGSALAMVDAGLVYWEMGKKEEGIALYQKAADLGDPAGQCNLGISYLQAEPPKPQEAVKWFGRAAISGHARAQYNLALCLHQGRGVESNLPKAAKWYLRAAEGGNVRAMYNTSLCYSSGQGLTRSHRQARKWMKQAADFGHSRAQFEHGLRLFSAGETTKALVYLELATRAGETAATHIKNVLLQQLSQASRDQAMQFADNWRPIRSR